MGLTGARRAPLVSSENRSVRTGDGMVGYHVRRTRYLVPVMLVHYGTRYQVPCRR